MKSFDIGEVLRESWGLFKKNWQGLLVVFATMLAVSIVPGILSSIFQKSLPWLSILISIVSWVLSLVTGMGIVKVALDVVSEKGAEVAELFFVLKDRKLILKYVGTSVLLSALLLPALVLFAIVVFVTSGLGQQVSTTVMIAMTVVLALLAIYVSVRLQFWMYVLVESGTWGRDALGKSWKMTKGMVLKLILFALALFVVNLAGMLLLLVGLLVTVPVSMLAMAVVYRKLEMRNGN